MPFLFGKGDRMAPETQPHGHLQKLGGTHHNNFTDLGSLCIFAIQTLQEYLINSEGKRHQIVLILRRFLRHFAYDLRKLWGQRDPWCQVAEFSKTRTPVIYSLPPKTETKDDNSCIMGSNNLRFPTQDLRLSLTLSRQRNTKLKKRWKV